MLGSGFASCLWQLPSQVTLGENYAILPCLSFLPCIVSDSKGSQAPRRSVSWDLKEVGDRETEWDITSSGSSLRLPAHFGGRIKKFHFVATVANEQEEFLGERWVPDHTGGIVALVGAVNVQDLQVVSVALKKIIFDLQRSPERHTWGLSQRKLANGPILGETILVLLGEDMPRPSLLIRHYDGAFLISKDNELSALKTWCHLTFLTPLPRHTVVPILQIRKQMFREVRRLAQSHIAKKW